MVIASDGLWDFLSDDEAVAIVADCIKKNDRVRGLDFPSYHFANSHPHYWNTALN